MAHQRQFREKELAKSLKATSEAQKQKQFEYDNLPEIEKLEYEIGRHQNTIINSKYDLQKSPNNHVILNKIQVAEESIISIKKRIEQLKQLNSEVKNESINN